MCVCVCVYVCVCGWVCGCVCVCVCLCVCLWYGRPLLDPCVFVGASFMPLYPLWFLYRVLGFLWFFVDFVRFRDFQDVLEGPWGSRGGPRGAHKQMLFFGGFLGWVPGGIWSVFGGMGRSLGQP